MLPDLKKILGNFYGFSPITQKLSPTDKNGVQIRDLHRKTHRLKKKLLIKIELII